MIPHLYVHIPFCPKVCPYCSFYKETSDRNKTKAFLDAVLREAERSAHLVRPRTIFFGGGTPTALSTSQLDYLISGLASRIDFSQVKEFTIEMNPATVSLEKAQVLLSLGVNRVSMGVQSWDPTLLEVLGRVHSAAQAQRSYEILREAGFTNVNLDHIFSVPGQTVRQWEETLAKTISLAPNHVSAYCLTYEEDTEYFLKATRGEFVPDPTRDADLFEMTMDVLLAAGYGQYEISNYAQPGRECLHNLGYWEGSDFLGLGPSAVSTVGRERWKNLPDTEAYVRRIQDGFPGAATSEHLDDDALRLEKLSLALRTALGVDEKILSGPHPDLLVSDGMARREGGRFILTRKGRMVADEIAEVLL